MMIKPRTPSMGSTERLRADLFQPPKGHKPRASHYMAFAKTRKLSTSGVGHRRDRGGLDGATTCFNSSRGLRLHAAWQASMMRLPINWFHQTSVVSTTSGLRRVRNGS